MEENIEELELTKEELENLSPEELVDLKMKLEDLIIECDELLEEDEE